MPHPVLGPGDTVANRHTQEDKRKVLQVLRKPCEPFVKSEVPGKPSLRLEAE